MHPAAAATVGVTVWAVKAFTSAWQNTAPDEPGSAELPKVTKGSPEEGWLLRARRAAASFADLADGMRGELLLDRVATMRPQIDDTVATLHRLAGQASLTATALSRFDPVFLSREHARLGQALRSAAPDVAAELEHALAAVTTQQQVVARLRGVHERVLARLQSGTLSLETLVARVVEVSTMTATLTPESTLALDDLSTELELTRQSLHELETLTRQDTIPD